MKLYEQKETTPLKFYKFFMYVYLPLCVFGVLSSVTSVLTFYKNLNWFYIENIAGSIFMMLLAGLMFWGLLRWKKFTFPLIVVFLAFTLATCVLNIVYFTALGGTVPQFSFQFPKLPSSSYNFSQYYTTMVLTMMKVVVVFTAVAVAVLDTLVFIYFYKRRRLFDDVPYTIPPQSAQRPVQAPVYPAYPGYPVYPAAPVYVERFCTACGLPRPATQYQFCPRCGKKYN